MTLAQSFFTDRTYERNRMAPKNSFVNPLVQQIEEGYRSRAWHGTNLRGSIRGLTIAQLSWRPGKNRHNIWEIVLHCAYWKYIVRRRLTGERQGSFPLKGNNFFVRPVKKSAQEWRRDLALVDEMHRRLIEEVKQCSSRKLRQHARGSRFTNLQTISGIAMHDVYHAGQIQLIKRLMKK